MSKYIPLEQADIDQAAHTDIKSYLDARGTSVERSGHEWMLADNHSVKFRDNFFLDHATGDKGTAIQFLQLYENMSFPDAVLTLLGERYTVPPVIHQPASAKAPRNPFSLPPKNTDMHRLYAYLMQERRISQEVISFFVHKRLIYESAKTHNIVFVGCDAQGNPRAAHQKGTLTQRPYRGDVPGSSKNYFFNYPGGGNALLVFEAPIDLMSFVCLHPAMDWQNSNLLALGCVSERALLQFLLEHPEVNRVTLCLDNDDAGRAGDLRLGKLLEDLRNGRKTDSKFLETELTAADHAKLTRDYEATPPLKSALKDWNEDLKASIKTHRR